jgi:predicted nucleic-acid-binding protein
MGRQEVNLTKVVVDTNVLVRAVVRDDPAQAAVAAAVLTDAELIAVALPSLCEFVWVLLRVYGFQPADAANAIRVLLATVNVEVNRPAVEAGLLVLDAGGDFADGVIAYEGHWLGGETFVSFDKKAVALLAVQGHSSHLL